MLMISLTWKYHTKEKITRILKYVWRGSFDLMNINKIASFYSQVHPSPYYYVVLWDQYQLIKTSGADKKYSAYSNTEESVIHFKRKQCIYYKLHQSFCITSISAHGRCFEIHKTSLFKSPSISLCSHDSFIHMNVTSYKITFVAFF